MAATALLASLAAVSLLVSNLVPAVHSGGSLPLRRITNAPDMRLLVLIALLIIPGGAAAQSPQTDEDQLRQLHRQLLQAHLEGSVDDWMAIEADSIVSVNGGHVSFPGFAQRRAQRAAYLRDATFSTYRDVREPLVRVSEDGTLGWLIAEVEVVGTRLSREGGPPAPIRDVWAWVELYEKTGAGWRLVGNASNRR